MDVRLSSLESDLLVRVLTHCPGGHGALPATALRPAEKAACNRLVQKGLLAQDSNQAYVATAPGRERATRIY